MEQKKIDMNKVTEKYALVLEHIAKAQNILTEELTPLLNDGASYESKVEKVADELIDQVGGNFTQSLYEQMKRNYNID